MPSNAEGAGSIPVGGAKMLQASQPKKPEHKIQKQYCNKLNKDFKNGPLKKNLKKPQWDTISYKFRWLLLKKNKVTTIDEDLEKLEYLGTVSMDVKWCSCYGKQYVSSSKN